MANRDYDMETLALDWVLENGLTGGWTVLTDADTRTLYIWGGQGNEDLTDLAKALEAKGWTMKRKEVGDGS